MLIKPLKTQAIFIILALLVTKRVQCVLPKLHSKRAIIRTLTVTYGRQPKNKRSSLLALLWSACYSASWTVFEILTLPINPRTVILCGPTTRILKQWTRRECYIYLPTCASSWAKYFYHLKWDLFVCSVYIPLRNSPRETRLDNDHFESLQESIYKFSSLGEVCVVIVETLTQEWVV